MGQQLLTVVGLAVGVAPLFASQISSASLGGSVQAITSRLAGVAQFQIEARDLEGVDQSLLSEVQRLPGVQVAIPVLQEPITLIGPTGERDVELIGTNPRLALQGSPLLRRVRDLARLPALALPAPLAKQIGASAAEVVRLRFDGRTVAALAGSRLTAQVFGDLVDSPVVIAPLTYAQQLTRLPGRITRVFVRAAPGREQEVRAGLMGLAAGRLNVEPANFDATLFGVAATPATKSQEIFSAISALVGFLFAFNAMLLTLPPRRRLTKSLRVNGATRMVIIRTLLFDALALGGLAALVGLALGDLLSLFVFRSSPGYLALAFPVGSQRIVSWQSAAIAAGAGLLASFVGVLSSLREPSPGPTAAPTMSGWRGGARPLQIGCLAAGTLCLALTTGLLIEEPQLVVLGCVRLVLALMLLLPTMLDAFITIFGRVQEGFGFASTRIAVIELRSPKTRARSMAIAATGAIAVFGSVALQGAKANVQAGLDQVTHSIASGSALWLVPRGGQDVLATTPFREVSTASLTVSGVDTVGVYRASFLDYGDRRLWVLAPSTMIADPIPSGQLTTGNLALAVKRLRVGGWAILSQVVAAQHHLHVGQSFTLPSPRPTSYRLAALVTNLGWAAGAVILNASDYEKSWGAAQVSAYTFTLTSGASAEVVRRELRRVLGRRSSLVVETARHRESAMRSATRQGLSRLTQIAVLVLTAAILAMSTAMGALIWQRRTLLGRLKVQGYDRRVLWRALACES